jgi:hypothetical protein
MKRKPRSYKVADEIYFPAKKKAELRGVPLANMMENVAKILAAGGNMVQCRDGVIFRLPYGKTTKKVL